MARAMVHVTSQTGTGRALRATGQPISDMSTTLTQASLPGEEEEFFVFQKGRRRRRAGGGRGGRQWEAGTRSTAGAEAAECENGR